MAPRAVKVAFIQDLSPEGALDRTLPAFQAVELAFSNAALEGNTTVAVELVAFDVAGDPAAAGSAATEIAADPDYVVAIAAPYLDGQQTLALGLGDVPLLSLSSGGRVAGVGAPTSLRFVAPLRHQARVLAELVPSRSRVCLAPATVHAGLDRAVRRALDQRIDVSDAFDATDVLESGCGVVVWTGDGAGAVPLVLELDGTSVAVVGGPRLRDPDFLDDAGRAAEGVLSICPCADVSTSLDLGGQRFIQDYQSEYGSAPGPFAVEAWDAARLLLDALIGLSPSRAEVAASIAATDSFEGLGGGYRFEGGELTDPGDRVHAYRVEGGRWTPVELAG